MITLTALALLAAPVILDTAATGVVMDRDGVFLGSDPSRGLHCVSFPSGTHAWSYDRDGMIPVGSDTSRKCWVSNLAHSRKAVR